MPGFCARTCAGVCLRRRQKLVAFCCAQSLRIRAVLPRASPVGEASQYVMPPTSPAVKYSYQTPIGPPHEYVKQKHSGIVMTASLYHQHTIQNIQCAIQPLVKSVTLTLPHHCLRKVRLPGQEYKQVSASEPLSIAVGLWTGLRDFWSWSSTQQPTWSQCKTVDVIEPQTLMVLRHWTYRHS